MDADTTDPYLSRAKESLETIAVVKQNVYQLSEEVFSILKQTGSDISDTLHQYITPIDNRVIVDYTDVSQHEFRIRVGGDLLIFSLHTNVFSFDRSHALFQTPYIHQDPSRAYFCMIEIFNFLNDSAKYNRTRDIGELVARIFVNQERHFMVEGMGAMGTLFSDLSTQVLDSVAISNVIENCITASINYDLWVPDFNQVRYLSLASILDQNGNSPRTTTKRLGFDIGPSV